MYYPIYIFVTGLFYVTSLPQTKDARISDARNVTSEKQIKCTSNYLKSFTDCFNDDMRHDDGLSDSTSREGGNTYECLQDLARVFKLCMENEPHWNEHISEEKSSEEERSLDHPFKLFPITPNDHDAQWTQSKFHKPGHAKKKYCNKHSE
ncbi:uncharacterized protein LOC134200749 [Bombyx mori]|uniref:uncharacterized protein LOC134200749 n=1 Tax=Bombyx mori TaxID=7091 RepID=UPI002ED27789